MDRKKPAGTQSDLVKGKAPRKTKVYSHRMGKTSWGWVCKEQNLGIRGERLDSIKLVIKRQAVTWGVKVIFNKVWKNCILLGSELAAQGHQPFLHGPLLPQPWRTGSSGIITEDLWGRALQPGQEVAAIGWYGWMAKFSPQTSELTCWVGFWGPPLHRTSPGVSYSFSSILLLLCTLTTHFDLLNLCSFLLIILLTLRGWLTAVTESP